MMLGPSEYPNDAEQNETQDDTCGQRNGLEIAPDLTDGIGSNYRALLLKQRDFAGIPVNEAGGKEKMGILRPIVADVPLPRRAIAFSNLMDRLILRRRNIHGGRA